MDLAECVKILVQMPIDDLILEAAKSELAFTTANQMSTLSDAAESSWINQVLKGVPQSHQRDLLAKAGVSYSLPILIWALFFFFFLEGKAAKKNPLVNSFLE